MIQNGGTFTQSGGIESGNPVQIESVTLADSTGTGSFDVVGSSTLNGTIPSGQTVTVDGSTTSVNLALPSRGDRRRGPGHEVLHTRATPRSTGPAD